MEKSAIGELIKNAPTIIDAAARSPLGLLALMVLVVGILAYLLFGRGDASQTVRAVIFIAILGSVTAFGVAVNQHLPRGDSIYRIRATIIGPSGIPVDGARVWSSAGGEAKEVSGGWEVDIPGGSVPAGGVVTIFAEKASAFVSGKKDVTLGDDLNPTATVLLVKTRVGVKGRVQDADGHAIEGASVSVPGAHGVRTSADGNFELQGVGAEGEQVRLNAEAPGYRSASQEHPAGDTPAVIVLSHE